MRPTIAMIISQNLTAVWRSSTTLAQAGRNIPGSTLHVGAFDISLFQPDLGHDPHGDANVLLIRQQVSDVSKGFAVDRRPPLDDKVKELYLEEGP